MLGAPSLDELGEIVVDPVGHLDAQLYDLVAAAAAAPLNPAPAQAQLAATA